MTEDRIDLAGLTLPTSDDERERLVGAATCRELTQLLISEWIPLVECDKCGRYDYCKFTKPDSYRSRRLAQIPCGVVETAVKNYVRSVFPVLQTLSPEALQGFLDGSYYLVKFLYEAELHIGYMICDEYIEWLGNEEIRASFFGFTARLRKHLDRFAGALRGVELFSTNTTIILTEGSSEKAFLERLRQSRLAWFTDLDVQSYDGKGNRGTTKLQLLVSRLRQQGYDLFIQGDRDGKIQDIFQQLVGKGLVPGDSTFAFEVDFETSFPAEMLYNALTTTGMLTSVAFDNFNDKASKRMPGESILDVLKHQFQIEVNKVELAEALADVFNQDMDLWDLNSAFWSSEIGRFLDKIRRLP